MNEQIQAHIDQLFETFPTSRKTYEVKEELLANCHDKYEDLLQKGMPPEDAFRNVIAGIGDIEELMRGLAQSEEFSPEAINQARVRRSLFVSISVVLYIIGFAIAVASDALGYDSELGFVCMLVLSAFATGLLIFGVNTSRVHYVRRDDTVTEEIKEHLAGSDKHSQLYGAITSTLWSLIVLLYLGGSFLTGWWHVSWIIFLLGSALQNAIGIVYFSGKKRTGSLYGLIWTLTVSIYFIISFATFAWEWTWIIFLVTVALQQVFRLWQIWKRTGQ